MDVWLLGRGWRLGHSPRRHIPIIRSQVDGRSLTPPPPPLSFLSLSLNRTGIRWNLRVLTQAVRTECFQGMVMLHGTPLFLRLSLGPEKSCDAAGSLGGRG